jgi:hypothetical protein
MLLPLNSGQTFQTNNGLRPENCPMLNSRKNNGMPQRNKNVKYGIRKAPVDNKFTEIT